MGQVWHALGMLTTLLFHKPQASLRSTHSPHSPILLLKQLVTP